MKLAEVVRKYLEQAGGYDAPLALGRLGLARTEMETLFAAWDEDYQISRFMLLSRSEKGKPPSEVFTINDCEYTHVAFKQGIEEFLGS